MKRKASSHKLAAVSKAAEANPWFRTALLWGGCLGSVLWFVATTSIASRIQLVMGYGTIPAGPPRLEIFLASHQAWVFAGSVAVGWIILARFAIDAPRRSQRALVAAFGAWGAASLVPLLVAAARDAGNPIPPAYWETLWLSGWSGLSFSLLASLIPTKPATSRRAALDASVLVGVAALTAVWWLSQAQRYHADAMFGFNDFGHFAQRLANTAAGRGVLLESPILPMFWDHFNPGLLLLVPLWQLFPDPQLLFMLQAVALACGAIPIWMLARQLKLADRDALFFGLAWLAQPVLGQMNLAYSYGWHPISLAIPLMLSAMVLIVRRRPGWACLVAVVAMSFEESVIVILCLFCAGCALQGRWLSSRAQAGERTSAEIHGLSVRTWSLSAIALAAAFVLVYRFSGLAEFQTGRFATLGNSLGEVVLSPVLRPTAFWGEIFRWEKLAFCLSLGLPCFMPSLLLGWRWLLPAVLPLGVLIVWDHLPATSLAFQYSSTLLPLFWLATLEGARSHSRRMAASGALATGLILSLFVGQLPYSGPTLLDVQAQTYGDDSAQYRRAKDSDGQWLQSLAARVRNDGREVLATGRIAAHLIGNRDVETVGQYVVRRPQLAELPDRTGQPILHYYWILLDRRESFQQTREETAAIETEALQAGFQVIDDRFDIVLLGREAFSE